VTATVLQTQIEQQHQLSGHWVLDTGTDIHVCNSRIGFKTTRPASEKDVLYSGKTCHQIDAFGSIDVLVKTLSGLAYVTLVEVALVKGYITNLISISRLAKKDIHFDTSKNHLHQNSKTFCLVTPLSGH